MHPVTSLNAITTTRREELHGKTDNMDSYNPDETYRLAVIREALRTHPDETINCPEIEGYLEAMLILEAGDINTKTTVNMDENISNAKDIPATIALITPPPSTSPTKGLSHIPPPKYDPEGPLITPSRSIVTPVESKAEHHTQSYGCNNGAGVGNATQVASTVCPVGAEPESFNQSHGVDKSTESKSSSVSSSRCKDHPGKIDPLTSERAVAGRDNKDPTWRQFDALVAIGLIATMEQNDPKAYLTIEKVQMYRTYTENTKLWKRYALERVLAPLRRGGPRRQTNSVDLQAAELEEPKKHQQVGRRHEMNMAMQAEQKASFTKILSVDLQRMADLMEDVPNKKDALSQPTMTKGEVLRKIQEQTERCGIRPVAALSGVLGAPSTASQERHVLSWTPSMNRSNEHNYLHTPYLSPCSTSKPKVIADSFDPDEIEEYDSDQTIPDLRNSESENNSNMPPTRKKQKQVHFQYNGPQPWMLDENRTDPVAVAAKNNQWDDMNDLLTGATLANPTRTNANRSSQMSKSNIEDPDISPQRSAKRTKLPDKVNDSANVHLRGGLIFVQKLGTYDRSDDFQRLKAARKIRDEDEMYEGLRNFEGRQRGWSGETESVRTITLQEYNLEQDRQFLEKYHKNKADYTTTKSTPKGKEPVTPRRRYLEPDYTGMSKEKKIKAMGKHLEDGYMMLDKQARESELEFDALMEENTRVTKAKMMARPWDLYAIKAEALAEQRARARPSLIVKLKINRSAKPNDSKKRNREDGGEAGSTEKRVRVQ